VEPEVAGGHQLVELLARGAASEVWRARSRDGSGVDVAVKRGPGLRAEAEVMARLDHPNVVRLLATVPDRATVPRRDSVAIVMPLAEGGSLEDLLRRRGRLDPAEAVAILAPLAEALAHVHGRGVVHGDVKPANVLLTASGAPLLADFGAAGDPAVVGSAAFVDPQRLASGRDDPLGDVYSLAVVAYRALTGRLPHTGADDDEVLEAAARGAHRSLLDEAEVPTALAGAVERGLALDPGERPASAHAFAAELADALAAGVVTRTFGPRPVRPQPAAPRRRVPRTVVGALAALGLVVAGAVAFVRHRTGSSQPTTACAPVDPLSVPTGAHDLRADLAGDGCPVQVVWDGTVMRFRLDGDVAPRRYDFTSPSGAPGSGALLLGDWDCDGADSPALYDPESGEVHYFALVPRTGVLTAAHLDATGIEDGRARVIHPTAGCDQVDVRPAA
jgi:hypothetical protein